MQGKYSQLVEFLEDEVGDSLRAVGKYDKESYEAVFIRDDVADEFSLEDVEKIHHEMVLKGLGNQHIESLFNDDNLNCTIYMFDSCVRFHFVHKDYRGCYVSVDNDADLDTSYIVDRAKEIME